MKENFGENNNINITELLSKLKEITGNVQYIDSEEKMENFFKSGQYIESILDEVGNFLSSEKLKNKIKELKDKNVNEEFITLLNHDNGLIYARLEGGKFQYEIKIEDSPHKFSEFYKSYREKLFQEFKNLEDRLQLINEVLNKKLL